MSSPRVALCLPGGGATGAMFQIGALAALEDVVHGLDPCALDLYVGTSSGASVAAALAGGAPVQRLYRAFLDPADPYFPLERRHLVRVDLDEWRRTLITAWGALRHGTRSMWSRTRTAPPTPAALWEELDRFNDSLPAGLFSLEYYERFLEDFFVRRGIPNGFHAMPRALRILAHDLDSGEPVLFGGPGFDHVPVARACAASMAVAPFFSPVRIGDRHYLDAGAAQISALDVAVEAGAEVLIVVNPMVPVDVDRVPTGHGGQASVRDKGVLWVMNQALRIGMHALVRESIARIRAGGRVEVIAIEPEPSDGILFMYNPASFAARRAILEYAYKTTRARMTDWLGGHGSTVARAGWRLRGQHSLPPPPEEG